MDFYDKATLDEIGRLLIPKTVRDELDLKEGNIFEVRVNKEENIEISKVGESKESMGGKPTRLFLD